MWTIIDGWVKTKYKRGRTWVFLPVYVENSEVKKAGPACLTRSQAQHYVEGEGK